MLASFFSGGQAAAQGTLTPDDIVTIVRKVAPDNGATGVELDRKAIIRFSWKIRIKSVDANSVSVTSGGFPIPTNFSFGLGRRSVVMEFPGFLPPMSTIDVRIDGDQLLDTSGSGVDADQDGVPGGVMTYSFSTGPGVDPPIETAPGTIVGFIYQPDGTPLAGALVHSVYYPASEGDLGLPVPDGVSDANGYFEYATVPIVGQETFLVRIRKPGYSEALRQVTLMANRCWRIEDAFLQVLTPPVLVTAAAGGALQDPAGGVNLAIPPGALQQDSNIGVTVLAHSGLIRDELPPSVVRDGVFTDVSGVFGDATNSPVTFQVPNTFNLPIGTRLPMGKIDHNTLEWMDLRDAYTGPLPVPDEYLGLVKSDGAGGTIIEIQFDHFCTVCTGYCLPYPTPSATTGSGANSGPDPGCDGSAPGNSLVGLREGHLWEDIQLPGFIERGKPFGLSLSYFSGGAYPSATISASVDYNSTRPIAYNVFDIEVEGIALEGVYGPSSNDQKPQGSYIWHGQTALGTTVKTGSYPYKIQFTSLNANAPIAVPSIFEGSWTGQSFGANYPGIVPLAGNDLEGRVSIVNLQDSEYGSGWRIVEEDRLYFDPDGCILLLYGTAQWLRFIPDPQSPNLWISPEEDYSTLLHNPIDGTFIRRTLQGGEDVFGANGSMLSRTDRYGAVTSFEQRMGRLGRVVSPTGYFYDLSYDGSGRLSGVTDSAGRSTSFVVDGLGDLIGVTNAVGATRTFEYDSLHLLQAHNGPRGERSEYDYVNGRVVATRAFDVGGGALLRQRTFAPSALNGEIGTAIAAGSGVLGNPIPLVEERVDVIVNGIGGVELHATDDEGRTLYREDALGRRTTYTYDGQGMVSSVTRPNGWKTEFDYDRGVLVAAREYDGLALISSATVELAGSFHQPSRTVDASGNESLVTYDLFGNVTELQDQLGRKLVFEYASAGNPQLPSSVVLHGGIRKEMTFDAHGNLASVTDFPGAGFPAGRVVSFVHGPTGRIVTSVDGEQRSTLFEFDAMGRLTKQTDPDLGETTYDYGDSGCGCSSENMTMATFANNSVFQFAYDGLGRNISDTDQLGVVRTFTYDPEGNLIASTNRSGELTQYQYDAESQLVRRELPGGDVTTFQYDALGNSTQMVDAMCALNFQMDFMGRTVRAQSSYDIQIGGGQLLTKQQVLDFSYDALGNRLTMSDDSGQVDLVYSYDGLYRLTGLLDQVGAQRTWSFTYDANGYLGTVDRGGASFSSTYSYDAIGQLSGILHNTAQTLQLAYGDYDGISDVGGVTVTGAALDESASYSYDSRRRVDAGTTLNTLGEVQVNQSGTFDSANRLLNNGEHSFAYDADGRLIQRVNLSTGVEQRYSWNTLGQLVHQEELVDVNSILTTVLTVDYCYDPLGRRIAKDTNGVTTLYLYDGLDLLHELDGAGRAVRSYTHGLGVDNLLALTDSVSGQSLHFLMDRQGSVMALAEDNGTLAQTYSYDEFGTMLSQSTPSFFQPFSYTGRELELEGGLHNYRMRYYDSEIGRFISPDPLGLLTGPNAYSYVSNNPVNWTDPLGLVNCDEQRAIGKAAQIVGGVASATGAATLNAPLFLAGVGLGFAGAYLEQCGEPPCDAAAAAGASFAANAVGGVTGALIGGLSSTDTWNGVDAIVNSQKNLDDKMRAAGLEP